MKRRLLAIALIAGALLVVAPGSAGAHPLGNFTVNTYAGLIATADGIRLDYVVDMAEIPAFEARQTMDADGDGSVSRPEEAAYATSTCAGLAGSLIVRLEGVRIAPMPRSHRVAFPPGAGGLATLRLECGFVGRTPMDRGDAISFEDRTFAGRIGWHEVTVRGDGVAVNADVPAESISRRLAAYPEDVLRSPPDVRRASATVTSVAAGSGAPAERSPDAETMPAGEAASGIDRLSRALVGFATSRDVTVGFVALAGLGAIALGALHAAAPGHGKTIIAAAVVGNGARRRNAVALGATVAAAHTASVGAIGVAVAAFGVAAPERVYPWLTLGGGIAAVAVGAGLVRRWFHVRRDEHPHDHARPHRTLVWLGLTGGLVPSPSALLLLLAAIGLGRTWLGIALVTCYGLGMAATLTVLALLVARAGRGIEGAAPRSRLVSRIAYAMRPVGAFGVVGAGVLLVARGVVAI